jgi:hypothetical protein
LRCNFLAYTTDLIPLRSSGGAQFSRQFSRFAVQASKGIVWEIYFHALHATRLATLIEDRKSNSAQLARRATALRKTLFKFRLHQDERGSAGTG